MRINIAMTIRVLCHQHQHLSLCQRIRGITAKPVNVPKDPLHLSTKIPQSKETLS